MKVEKLGRRLSVESQRKPCFYILTNEYPEFGARWSLKHEIRTSAVAESSRKNALEMLRVSPGSVII